jgi:hypothetical protein
MQKFMVMSMVKLEGKHRVVKVVSTRVLPTGKRKEPAGTGSNQNK